MGREVSWNPIRLFPVEFALILDPIVWSIEMKRMRCPENKYPDSAAGTTFFLPNECGTRRAIVTMNLTKPLEGIQVAAMLAHEGQHIVQYIEDEIGEQKFSWEAECYLLQMIVQDLMQDYVELGGHVHDIERKTRRRK